MSKGLNYNQNNILKFNESGLRSVICTLSSMRINGLNYKDSEELKNNFINISSNNYFLLEDSKLFFNYQMSAMDQYSAYEFQQLLNHEFKKDSFMEDEALQNFISEEVLDETHLIRNIEYGYYCLISMTAKLFKGIDENDVLAFSKKFQNKDIINLVLEILINEHRLKNKSLPFNLNKLLLSSFELNFSNKILSPEFFYDFGLTIKNDSITIIKNGKALRETVSGIISSGLNQKLRNKIRR